ncbi:ABC transporter permease [Rahnella bonaserana]|jgi:lipopolysaccharide transport system permease protein
MQSFNASPREFVASAVRNRALIYNLVKREVIGRYKGSMLGILWSFFNPVFMLAVYTFVFSVVFNARWAGGGQSKTEFALILFAGLIVFNLFADCFNRAPGLVLANANYVKKVVFPLEILPWVAVGSALFHAMISVLVWVIFYMFVVGVPHLTILLLPITIIPLVLLSVGVSWALASLGVYLRDVSQLVAVLTTVLMFLSPIFFPIEALPEQYRPLLKLNPLAPAIAEMRDILYFGGIPKISSFCIYFAACSLVAWLGFAWFQKTRKGFADVL